MIGVFKLCDTSLRPGFLREVEAFPEYNRDYVANAGIDVFTDVVVQRPFTLNARPGLSNPSAYHNTFVRKLRTMAHTVLSGTAPSERFVQKLDKIILYESVEEPVAPSGVAPGDVRGWINLSDFSQTVKSAEDNRIWHIPPGHMVIFREPFRIQSARYGLRLLLWWTQSVSELDFALFKYLRPPYDCIMYDTDKLDVIEAFSAAAFRPQFLTELRVDGRWYALIPLVFPGLYELDVDMRDVFPPYSTDELALYGL